MMEAGRKRVGEMESYRECVKSDCELLLTRFKLTESVRFEVFSKIWKDMKFSHIFCGTERQEKRGFSRLALDTACSYFLPPFNFQIRVGGLYLMYSLFCCQDASPPEQIRLALKDWEDMKKFEKDALDASHMDVIFILRQLFVHKAFQFTAMPTLLAFRKHKVKPSMLHEEFIERPSRPQELININMLEELSNIHELYEKQKTAVSPSLGHLDSSVKLIREDLVPQLRSTVMDFYKWQQQKNAPPEDDSGEGTSSSLQECSRRADLLSSIKSKAFGLAAEACKSRRHRQVELDLATESGPAPLLGHTRRRKPSLKARTDKNVHISGDVWKDALTTTNIHHLSSLESVEEKTRKRDDSKC
ncbi:snRNA-activating protein complex subunit 1b [Genypterus blacodes]|uniref:snRNA-activating protein complex subunit 1b n=1 Tax=Genypterus blacodes TaxID=154954 RepID=UPI003F778213